MSFKRGVTVFSFEWHSGCPLATILKLIESNNFMVATFSNSQATHKIISYAEFALLDCIMSTDVAATL